MEEVGVEPVAVNRPRRDNVIGTRSDTDGLHHGDDLL